MFYSIANKTTRIYLEIGWLGGLVQNDSTNDCSDDGNFELPSYVIDFW